MKKFSAGTRAIIAWSAIYTAIAIAAGIYYRGIETDGYGGIIPNMDTGLSTAETVIFYVIVYGGFVVSWLIGCRINVNIDEVTENLKWRKVVRVSWFDLPLIIVEIVILVACWNMMAGAIALVWVYAARNLVWLWKFRKELGLAT